MSGQKPAAGTSIDGADGTLSGAEAPHVPVLLHEVLEALSPKPGGIYVDGTFGAGGYTSAILEAAPGCRVVALDRDPTAIAAARPLLDRYGARLQLVEAPFSEIEAVAASKVASGMGVVDGVVVDIGVSSMQLDMAERGFSFRADGPLEMRMGGDGPTAAEVIAETSEAELADILFQLGEERQARRIARAIVHDRATSPLTTTRQLAELVARVVGRKKHDDIHPATRTFQALRIWVNDELGELAALLAGAERLLRPGGRLVVVSFHSLEDRIVKRFLSRRAGGEGHGSRHAPLQAGHRADPSFRILYRRPISPTEREIAANPRARSAKLRAGERTGAPAWSQEQLAELGVPSIRSASRR